MNEAKISFGNNISNLSYKELTGLNEKNILSK